MAAVLLDHPMPRRDLATVHQIAVAASPERARKAMLEVTSGEMPVARLLFTLRGLPSLLRGRTMSSRAIPLHSQMLASSFVLLAEEPGREVVLGFVGQPRKPRIPTIPIRDTAEFVAFAAPGGRLPAVVTAARWADTARHASDARPPSAPCRPIRRRRRWSRVPPTPPSSASPSRLPDADSG